MTDAAPAASRRSDTRGARGGFALANLPSSIRDAVCALDKDGSGYVDEGEFVAAVEQMVQQRRDSRLLKQILASVVVLNLLLTAAVVGCVWGLVAAMKDTESTGGALADKATGVPLRTAAGHLPITKSRVADEDVLAVWVGADGAATPGLYGSGGLEYVVSVNASDFRRACALNAEGHGQMVVLGGAGEDETRRMVVDSAACPEGGGGAEALVEYNGKPLLARCPADVSGAAAKCHVFRDAQGNATDDNASGARRRSLLGAGASRAPVRVFAGTSELRCDAGRECQVIDGESQRRSLSAKKDACCTTRPWDCGAYPGADPCVTTCGPCPSCFPADARATLEGGATKPMSALAIGDRVLTADAAGALAFSDVYMFGHRDAAAAGTFAAITTESGAVLRLSLDHYLPTASASAKPWEMRVLLPARFVTTKHSVWVAHGGAARAERVVDVALRADAGLFNPYTLTGAIVVDGVVASCHSSSFADAAFERLGVSLPAGYQALFAPLRALYRAIGPAAAEWVQGTVGAAAIGAIHGPSALASAVTSS
jgi:hypothetical protein